MEIRDTTTHKKPDIVFVNGESKCGCRTEFSSGHGEYSDVTNIYLCKEHKGLEDKMRQAISYALDIDKRCHGDDYLYDDCWVKLRESIGE